MANFGVKKFISEINGKWLILFLLLETVFLAGKNYHGNESNQEYVKNPTLKGYECESFQESQRPPISTTDMLEKQSILATKINTTDTKKDLPNEKAKNLDKKQPQKAKTEEALNLPECNIDLCPRRFPQPQGKPLRIVSDMLPSIEYIAHGSDLIICNTYKKLSSDDSRRFCNELEKFQKEHNLTSHWSLSKDDRFRLSSFILNDMGYEQRVPNVIGIGVKKCGSSAMLILLGLHPQIHCGHGEGSFFSVEDRYLKGPDMYRSKSLFSKEGEITFEKTPGYFMNPDVPNRMKQTLPDSTKFYFSVRDPVERTISDFHHVRVVELIRAVNKTGFTPESEGQLFLERLFDEGGNVRSDNLIINVSCYALYFKSFLEKFPLSSFHIEDASDIRNKPIDALQRVEQFMEVDAFFKSDMLVDPPSSDFGTCLHIHGKDECTRIVGQKHPKPYVNEATIKKLRDYFRPFNEEFEKITGQKFLWTRL